jgi:hypothetical protein
MGVQQELWRALHRGLIHLCVKDNKTVPLLDWHVLAVIRKEKYGLHGWLASLVKICQEILLTMQWLNWTCCVTGPTSLPASRVLTVMLCFSPCERSLGNTNPHWDYLLKPLLFYTFCIRRRKKYVPNDAGGREAHRSSLAWVPAWNRWALVKDLYEKMVRNCFLYNNT